MSASLFLHPLAKPSSAPAAPPSKLSASDVALAQAVRKHLFDFKAAAEELGLDAADCRSRWAELDLSACVGYAAAAPDENTEQQGPFASSKPSDFNIFHNSLGKQMDSIFSGVRATLPSMDDDDDDSDSEASPLRTKAVPSLKVQEVDDMPALDSEDDDDDEEEPPHRRLAHHHRQPAAAAPRMAAEAVVERRHRKRGVTATGRAKVIKAAAAVVVRA